MTYSTTPSLFESKEAIVKLTALVKQTPQVLNEGSPAIHAEGILAQAKRLYPDVTGYEVEYALGAALEECGFYRYASYAYDHHARMYPHNHEFQKVAKGVLMAWTEDTMTLPALAITTALAAGVQQNLADRWLEIRGLDIVCRAALRELGWRPDANGEGIFTRRKTPLGIVPMALAKQATFSVDNGTEVICTGYATADSVGLVFLSVLGPQEAVRAVFARLMQDRNLEGRKEGSHDNGIWLYRDKHAKYHRHTRKLPCGLWHMALIHERAAVNSDYRGVRFVLSWDAVEPPPTFFPILNAASPVPMLAEWAGELWKKGLEARAIWPMTTVVGLCGWHINPTEEKWAPIVKSIVQGDNDESQ